MITPAIASRPPVMNAATVRGTRNSCRTWASIEPSLANSERQTCDADKSTEPTVNERNNASKQNKVREPNKIEARRGCNLVTQKLGRVTKTNCQKAQDKI